MRWTKRGANLLLQVRFALLVGVLLLVFRRWYSEVGTTERRFVGSRHPSILDGSIRVCVLPPRHEQRGDAERPLLLQRDDYFWNG